MTWRTHALFGADCALCLLPVIHFTPEQNHAALATLAACGALLPDLDASESKVRHIVKFGEVEPLALFGDLVHGAFGHRGLLHSAAGLLIAGAIIAALCIATAAATTSMHPEWQAGAALWLGYASHLAADACTPSGIPLWYPDRRRVRLLPKALRITTGSAAEDALMPLLALPILFVLLRQLLGAA